MKFELEKFKYKYYIIENSINNKKNNSYNGIGSASFAHLLM